jgi:hypothetical protein
MEAAFSKKLPPNLSDRLVKDHDRNGARAEAVLKKP